MIYIRFFSAKRSSNVHSAAEKENGKRKFVKDAGLNLFTFNQLNQMKMNTIFPYFGGKFRLSPIIIKIMPPHQTYVEIFGGSGAVLFRKNPSKVEIFNDIDGNLINFFRILRDENKFKILQEKLELTPFSREEHFLAKSKHKNNIQKENSENYDEIERAREFYVNVRMAFSGMLGSGFSVSLERNNAKIYFNAINKFPQFHKRIKNTAIENLDFRKLIQNYDSEQTLFYADPPYTYSVRKSKNDYEFEMSEKKHVELLEILMNVKGMVILSGYDSQLYEKLEHNGWLKTEHEQSLSVTKTKNNKRDKRIECLWLNKNAQKRTTLNKFF